MALTELVPWRTGRRNLPVRGEEQTNPFAELQRQMGRLFDDFFSDVGLQPWRGLAGIESGFYPRMEVAETEKELLVTAEVPGIEPKDVEITVADGVLTIKGEKKQATEEKKEGYYLAERTYGAFTRAVALPVEVDEGKIEATYKDGVLKIRLPKAENQKARAKKVEVKAG